jgi:hypothetical protein
MIDLFCDICNKNFIENNLNNYPVIINNKLSNMCNFCFDKIINKEKIYISISVIFSEKHNNYKFLNKINIFLLSQNCDFDAWYILNYNKLEDKIIIQKVKNYLLKFYGGKKLIIDKLNIPEFIDFKIDVIEIKPTINCAICNKKLDSAVYFFKKANVISVVCKECNDIMYKKGELNEKEN